MRIRYLAWVVAVTVGLYGGHAGVDARGAGLVQSAGATETTCGPTPPELSGLPFGHVLHVLQSTCVDAFSEKEQLFIAGLSAHLLEKCQLPSDMDDQQLLRTFLISMGLVGGFGSEYGADFGSAIDSQYESGSALIAGGKFGTGVPCADRSARAFANGTVSYLRRTRASSRFVPGCVRHYGQKASAEQCQCLADVARAVFPEVHQQEFSSEYYQRLIKANPFVGVQVMIQCRIVEY